MASGVGLVSNSRMPPREEATASSTVARTYYPVVNQPSSTLLTNDRVAYASLVFFVALCTFPPGAVFAAAVVVLVAGGALIGFNSLISSVASRIFSSPSNSKTTKPKQAEKEINLDESTRQAFGKIYSKQHGSPLRDETLRIIASVDDQGGHGGNLKASAVTESGKLVHFFLKPINLEKPVEQQNYAYLNDNAKCATLRPFMVGTYNDPIEINGQFYMIMDNLCIGNDGKKKTVLADIKLAGKVDGINPIASMNEIKGTERNKSWLNYAQMWLSSLTADHFELVQGPKFLRFFIFWKSRENFEKILEKASIDKLEKLKNDLVEIRKAMKESQAVFIGSSILLLQDGDGNLEPKLIDPAHMQVNPALPKDPSDPPVYRGTQEEYDTYYESNRRATEAIIETVEKVIKAKRAASAP